MVGGSMFANILNFLYQSVMGKVLLTPSQYGQLSSLFAILYIVIIIPQSTSASIVKFASSAKNHNEAAFVYLELKKFILRLAIVFSVVVILISPFLANFLHVELLNVLIIAPALFLNLIGLVNQSTMQGVLRFWGNVGPSILSTIFKLIFGVIFVLLGWKVFGAMTGMLIGTLFAYLYSRYLIGKFLAKNKPKGKFELSKFLKYSFPVLINSFAFTSFFTMDLVLVKHFLPDVSAGHYAALSNLGRIIFFAASPIAATMFPFVAGRHARSEKYFNFLLIGLLITTLVSFGVVGFYYLFPNIAIGLLYGSKYLVVSSELVWMGLFICFYTISYFIVSFFLSIDEIKIVILPLVFAILQIVLILIYHNNILQIIQISLVLMVILFVILFTYLVYNRLSYERNLS